MFWVISLATWSWEESRKHDKRKWSIMIWGPAKAIGTVDGSTNYFIMCIFSWINFVWPQLGSIPNMTKWTHHGREWIWEVQRNWSYVFVAWFMSFQWPLFPYIAAGLHIKLGFWFASHSDWELFTAPGSCKSHVGWVCRTRGGSGERSSVRSFNKWQAGTGYIPQLYCLWVGRFWDTVAIQSLSGALRTHCF